MTVTNYLWDEDSYLEEYDYDGTTTAAYTNEPRGSGRVVSQRRNSTTSFNHYNAQGSTHQLTDQNENVTDTFLYDAWGDEVDRTGSTTAPFRYIGEFGYYFDEETDSYYVRARYYAPLIAQLLSLDPLELNYSSNKYIYSSNNPIQFIDPSGLATIPCSEAYSHVYFTDPSSIGNGADKPLWDKEGNPIIYPPENPKKIVAFAEATIRFTKNECGSNSVTIQVKISGNTGGKECDHSFPTYANAAIDKEPVGLKMLTNLDTEPSAMCGAPTVTSKNIKKQKMPDCASIFITWQCNTICKDNKCDEKPVSFEGRIAWALQNTKNQKWHLQLGKSQINFEGSYSAKTDENSCDCSIDSCSNNIKAKQAGAPLTKPTTLPVL